MAGKPSLENLLVNVPSDRLDKKISDDVHLRKIADHLTSWQSVRPYLSLFEKDEEDIRDCGPINIQRMAVLEKWREKKGLDATYRNLAKAFYEANKVNMVEVVCGLLCSPTHSRSEQLRQSLKQQSGCNFSVLLLSMNIAVILAILFGIFLMRAEPSQPLRCPYPEAHHLEKVREETLKLQDTFAGLIRKVLVTLKEIPVDVKAFKVFLLGLSASTRKLNIALFQPEDIYELKTLDDLFFYLCVRFPPPRNFLNYHLMQRIVNEYKTDSEVLDVLMINYVENASHYMNVTNCCDYMCVMPMNVAISASDVPMEVEFNISCNNCTLAEVENIRQILDVGISNHAVRFQGISSGSVHFWWTVPSAITPHLKRVAIEKTQLFSQLGIIRLAINGSDAFIAAVQEDQSEKDTSGGCEIDCDDVNAAFQREKFVIQDNRPFMLEFPAQDVLFDPTDIDPSCQSNGAHLVDCVLTHTIVCPDVRREGIFTINVTISNRLSGFCPVTVTFIATELPQPTTTVPTQLTTTVYSSSSEDHQIPPSPTTSPSTSPTHSDGDNGMIAYFGAVGVAVCIIIIVILLAVLTTVVLVIIMVRQKRGRKRIDLGAVSDEDTIRYTECGDGHEPRQRQRRNVDEEGYGSGCEASDSDITENPVLNVFLGESGPPSQRTPPPPYSEVQTMQGSHYATIAPLRSGSQTNPTIGDGVQYAEVKGSQNPQGLVYAHLGARPSDAPPIPSSQGEKSQYSQILPHTTQPQEEASPLPPSFETATQVADQPPTLDTLTELLQSVASKWQPLGLYLGVSDDLLDEIYTNMTTEHDCMVEMIDWRLRQVEPLTWKEVAEALHQLGERQLAETVAEIHDTGILSSLRNVTPTREETDDNKPSIVDPGLQPAAPFLPDLGLVVASIPPPHLSSLSSETASPAPGPEVAPALPPPRITEDPDAPPLPPR